jgi:hypothetical protein
MPPDRVRTEYIKAVNIKAVTIMAMAGCRSFRWNARMSAEHSEFIDSRLGAACRHPYNDGTIGTSPTAARHAFMD